MEIVRKLCKACGDLKPIEEMSKSKSCKHGVDSICKVCKNKKAVANYWKNNKKQKESEFKLKLGDMLFSEDPKPSDPFPIKDTTNMAVKENTVTIDFNLYPDILATIENSAREEFRTLEMQIIYTLVKATNDLS